MKLYHQIEGVHLQECPVEDIDFSKPTLIVFPGREAVEDDEKRPGALIAGLNLSRRILDASTSQNVQILIAAWDKKTQTTDRVRQLNQNHPFVSEEAAEFMDKLSQKAFNTHRTTFLGWSYGSCFIQECANRAQEKGYAIDKTQALTIGTVIPPDRLSVGFSGVYFYGANDRKIQELCPSAWSRFSSHKAPHIETIGQHHICVAVPIPTQIVRWRSDLQLIEDSTAHTAMAYADADGGSYRIDEQGKESICPEHVPIVRRFLRTLTERDESYDQTHLLRINSGLNGNHSAIHPYKDPITHIIGSSVSNGYDPAPKR